MPIFLQIHFIKKSYTMEMTSHVHACVRAYVFRLATTIRH